MAEDLIKTIEDGDEVPDMSEESDSDDDGQPKKNKVAQKVKKDFDVGFKFVGNQREYMADTWNDVGKYVKRKARTTLDDKELIQTERIKPCLFIFYYIKTMSM